MDSITFCIPHYSKNSTHVEILMTCIKRIRMFYPKERILICKTSDSLPFDLSAYENIDVFNTYADGSHVFGAIELLLRKCETTRYIICHDSMFILKPLPESYLQKELYPLWHFNEAAWVFYTGYTSHHVKSFALQQKEIAELENKHTHDKDKQLNGIFGPAFGGSIGTLKKIWSILNIADKIDGGYLKRPGLMMSERVFSVLFTYLGVKPEESLNGNIYKHPNVFNSTTIPDFEKIVYPDSYFWKIWQKRN